MAAVFESDVEDLAEILDDTDDDDNDDDYVPDGGNSDSDAEYGKRKRKSSQSTPNKRTRSSSRSSATSPTKTSQQSNKKVASSFRSRRSNSSQKQTPNKSKKIQKKKTTSSPSSKTGSSSLRRSSRSTRARGVSYVDADVSEEENFDNDDISNESDNVYDSEEEISEKKEGKRKQHVDELWSSFKNDVGNSKKNIESKVSDIPDQKRQSSVSDGSKDKTSVNMKPENTECKTESTELNKTSSSNTEPKKKEKAVAKNENENNSKDEEKKEKEKFETKTKTQESSSKETKHLEKTVIEPSTDAKKAKEDVSKATDAVESNEKSANVNSKQSDGSEKRGEKVTITETFDFAGEKVTKSKVVDANSSEAKQFQQKSSEKVSVAKQPGTSAGISNILSSGIKKSGGLSSVLGSIDKKKKMSVLDKSKYDWDNYKQDNGLEDELKSNRSAGYLDRQEFLQRVEYKQWENEREMRLYSNHK